MCLCVHVCVCVCVCAYVCVCMCMHLLFCVHFLPLYVFLVPRSCSAQPPAVSLSMSLLQDLSCGRTTLAGLGSVESSYLIQSAPCIKTPDHSDLPSIMVLIEYLGALEVPPPLPLPPRHCLSCTPPTRVLCGGR